MDTIAKLTKAVNKQTGGNLKEIAQDVCNHGANSGFSGFIYYHETEAFYLKNKSLIVEMAKEMADSLGEPLIGMIQGFNCLDATEEEIGQTLYGNKKNCDQMVANALAWFALEEVARNLTDN
jgi:hypothetical protein